MAITGKKIVILATHGFEQSELEVPLQTLKDAGAIVDVVSPETSRAAAAPPTSRSGLTS